MIDKLLISDYFVMCLWLFFVVTSNNEVVAAFFHPEESMIDQAISDSTSFLHYYIKRTLLQITMLIVLPLLLVTTR